MMNLFRTLTVSLLATLGSCFRPVVGMLALAVIASAGHAQIKDAKPAYFAVASDKVLARCKDSNSFYEVAELAKNQVIYMDGESENWARVAYPPDLTAFVRVEDVSVTGDSLRLSQPSKLKAAHLVVGWPGSWQALLPNPLPVGTVLRKKDDVRETAQGSVVGYRVFAPAQARMFVPKKSLRPATDAEIAAYRAKAGTPDIASVPSSQASSAPAPGQSPDQSQPVAPTPTTPAQSPTDLTQPQGNPNTPGDTQPLQPPLQPIETVLNPPTLQQGGQNTDITPPSNPTTPPTPTDGILPTDLPLSESPAQPQTDPKISEYERQAALAMYLESKLRSVIAQPPLTSEVDELIAEYEVAIAAETSPSRRKGLEGRLEYLRVRREFRDTVRRQQEARAALDANAAVVQSALAEVARSRVYTLVGELQPSSVYDGKQLPLMYRVIAVGTSAPRTLGYLKQSQEWDLDKMLGLLVGVIGQADIDRSLKLNIVSPVRVEVLTAGAGGQPYRIDPAPRIEDRPAQPSEPETPADMNK
jgi:hypothetical protein